MAEGDHVSQAFLDWRSAPGRSAVGAVVGLVSAWSLSGFLVLHMVEIPQGSPAEISGAEFVLWMAAPFIVGVVACLSGRVRYRAGALVPGAIVGWTLGCMAVALVGLLSLLG